MSYPSKKNRHNTSGRSAKFTDAVSIGVIIGFTIGLIYSVFLIILPNMYFRQKMFRISALILTEHLNRWVIGSFGLSILSITLFFLGRLISASQRQKGPKPTYSLQIFVLGALLTFSLLCYGGWIMVYSLFPYHAVVYKTSLLNLLGIMGTLFLIISLVWLFSHIRYIRKIALVLTLSLLVLNLWFLADGRVRDQNGPNVILISIDTLRADHLGSYGYSRNTSPHIDAFAKESILFKNCFVQDDWTLSSHMSILTSLYPVSHGVKRNQSLDPSITTLAEVLKNEGYFTMGFVRHCLWMDAQYGFDQGFDRYFVKDYSPEHPERNAEFQNRFILDYVEKYRKRKLFLFLHYYDVHSDFKKLPYDAPEPYKTMFAEDYHGDFTGGFGLITASKYLGYLNHYNIKINEDDLKFLASLYDAGIAYTDKNIGDLFTALKKMGLYENTLIILTSDHGEEFQEHGKMSHHSNLFYDETMRVPLIIKLPGRTGNPKEVSRLIESIDIMPSILAFLGVKKLPKIQGANFFGFLYDKQKWKKYAFAVGSNGNAFVRTERWKLLNDNPLRTDGFRLFDILTDPEETQDVVTKYPGIAKQLQKKLLEKYGKIREKTSQKQVTLTEKQKKLLKSLGYIN